MVEVMTSPQVSPAGQALPSSRHADQSGTSRPIRARLRCARVHLATGQRGNDRGRRGGVRRRWRPQVPLPGAEVPGWIWRDTTQEQRDAAQLEQTGCGTDGPTSGLIGYLDGEPAGWVAVEPRENYPSVEPEAVVDADGP